MAEGTKEAIRSLCGSQGWAYGIIWRNERRGSMMLVPSEVYHEDEVTTVIERLLHQVHMVGEGIIGQVAFCEKHRWILAENHSLDQVGLNDNQDDFQDPGECDNQFSSGIKTIALIPLSSRSVLELGSLHKMLENLDFVDHTKHLFRKLESPLESSPSENSMQRENSGSSIESSTRMPLNIFPQKSHGLTRTVNASSSVVPVATTGQLLLSQHCIHGSPTMIFNCFHQNLPLPFVNANATFRSFNRGVDEIHILPQNEYASRAPYILHTQQGFDPHKALCSIPRTKVTDLRHVGTPVYNFDPLDLGGRTSSLQSTSSYASGVEVDTDVDHNAPSTQFLSGGHLYNDQPSKQRSNLNVGSSHSMSDLQIASSARQQISYGGGGSTIIGLNPSSSSGLQTSSSSLERNDPSSLSAPSTLIRSPDVILPPHTGKSPHVQESPTGVSLTTQEGASTSEGTKMAGKRNVIEQCKKLAPTKVIQKKARPGQGGRPRPKDRQQIQDRIRELRYLVPSGEQSSIDRLLGRTFKYVLFLQGMVKYAKGLPSIDEPRIIEGGNGFVLKDSGGDGNGCTWAFEIGGQIMICPLMVEDLNPTGQMFVEIICEENGYFLEIADMIKGFGLVILRGVMEIKDDKIWSRFIVEANKEVTRMDIFLSLVQLLQHISGSNSNSRNAALEESSHGGPPPSI